MDDNPSETQFCAILGVEDYTFRKRTPMESSGSEVFNYPEKDCGHAHEKEKSKL